MIGSVHCTDVQHSLPHQLSQLQAQSSGWSIADMDRNRFPFCGLPAMLGMAYGSGCFCFEAATSVGSRDPVQMFTLRKPRARSASEGLIYCRRRGWPIGRCNRDRVKELPRELRDDDLNPFLWRMGAHLALLCAVTGATLAAAYFIIRWMVALP
jgi:hypothetical protein